MEFSNFLKVLARKKFILITIPIVTVLITYFFVSKLPDTYTSRTRIATGITDRSDALLKDKEVPEVQVTQQFTNLIQTISLKKVISQVSYALMIHDLTAKTPFREPSKMLSSLSSQEKQRALQVYQDKMNKAEELSLSDNEQNKFYRLLISMKYDPGSLLKKIIPYRVSQSDFIDIEYESENPELSAFVLNTLTKDFIDYYASTVKENNTNAVKFLDSLMHQKQQVLNEKIQNMRDYKIKNGILDVNEESGALVGQIAEFEAKKQEAENSLIADKIALQKINADFSKTQQRVGRSSVGQINENIDRIRGRLNAVNEEYIRSNYSPRYKPQLDSLQNALAAQIDQVNDKTSYVPSVANKELVTQKMTHEVSAEQGKNNINTINQEINKLNSKLKTMVPNQAALQGLQNDVDIASRDYLDVTKKFDQASMEASYSLKLRQVEMALPGVSAPSKKLLLIILAGILSLVFCIVVLLILFFFDNSIVNTMQLANRTHLPVIGILNLIKGQTLDLKEVWARSNESTEIQDFKGQLRSIRFEIDSNLTSSKIIAITSLQPGEGKTFVALNLAYAYTMINKRVLLIDGNFHNPAISEMLNPGMFIEDYLLSDNEFILPNVDGLVVLANKGGDTSLLEINRQSIIQRKLQALKDQFDIILIETPSLNLINKAKEWIIFADMVVPVFEVNHPINSLQKQEVNYLNSLYTDSKLTGWILNKAKNVTTPPARLEAKNDLKLLKYEN